GPAAASAAGSSGGEWPGSSFRWCWPQRQRRPLAFSVLLEPVRLLRSQTTLAPAGEGPFRGSHKRSKLESVFSAVKRKFSVYVRSRTPAAMVNESLAKLLCNNLCCVILSQIELGIEAEFWEEKNEECRDLLPMNRA